MHVNIAHIRSNAAYVQHERENYATAEALSIHEARLGAEYERWGKPKPLATLLSALVGNET